MEGFTEATPPVIELKGVSKVYPLAKKETVTAVRGLDLAVRPCEFVIITGRSGSGKTTVLNLAAGLTRPTSGEVRLDGADVWKLPDREQSRLRSQKLGFVFQFPSLMPSLTALENVLLPTLLAGERPAPDYTARAEALLAEVGLADKRRAYPRQLSAGQQQRVVIARALVNQPELLLADEPTSNLDERTEHEIMELFQRIHQERGVTVLLVTHTTDLLPYGTRPVRMVNGEIV